MLNKEKSISPQAISHSLILAGVLCVGLGSPAAGQDGEPPRWPEQDVPLDGNVVDVDEYGTVDIAVQDTDLAQVLQMLSIHSQKNIITSKNVSATVTANLYDVTFYEALDAILHVNGYGYKEKGNFIYIYTLEELQEMEEAARVTESRIFILDHLSAPDAAEFITPLLSENGQAAVRGEVTPGFVPSEGDGGADTYAYTAALVVNDYPENLEAIGELLDELDTPPQQVLVEATIVQTALDETNAFGIDFNIIGSLDFTNLTNPLSAVNDLLTGNAEGSGVEAGEGDGFQPGDDEAYAVGTSVGNTSGPGGLKIGIIDDDISVFLRVLDEVTDNTVLARPRIMALNRQRAEVLVGARVGYLSTTATETTTTQTVEFLDTGIQLIFRPFISKDGSIRMELKPSVSEARLRNVTDAQGQLVTIPDELTNELTTNVRVQDGQTLVLGGLYKESTSITRRQVPFLGDVPLLGAAFRGQDDTISRSEIIFLITPTIVPDPILWEAGEEAMAWSEYVRVGARNGLLPFSNTALTDHHNQDALQALEEGNEKLALFHINSSLHLKPNQPEIIKLKDRLTGREPSRIFERSIMNRLLHKEIDAIAARVEDEAFTTAEAIERDPLADFKNSNETAFADEIEVVPFPDTGTAPANEEFEEVETAIPSDTAWEEVASMRFEDPEEPTESDNPWREEDYTFVNSWVDEQEVVFLSESTVDDSSVPMSAAASGDSLIDWVSFWSTFARGGGMFSNDASEVAVIDE